MGRRGARPGVAPLSGMTLVLDAGGLTMLAGHRARLEELRRREEWPPLAPSVILTEALTGDHRRDFHENRLLRTCTIWDVDEALARRAAALRTAAAGSRTPSAVDAMVVAVADTVGGATVLTTDPRELRALARHTVHTVRVG
jgi:predicted nucleic acid-binding protein